MDEFKKGNIYQHIHSNVIVEITEFSGATAFFRILEDPKEFYVFSSGILHRFEDLPQWEEHLYYNTPLYKVLNRADGRC